MSASDTYGTYSMRPPKRSGRENIRSLRGSLWMPVYSPLDPLLMLAVVGPLCIWKTRNRMRIMHDAPSMRMGLATAILNSTECETAASKRQAGGQKKETESSWYRRDFGCLRSRCRLCPNGSSVATQTTRQLPPPINTKSRVTLPSCCRNSTNDATPPFVVMGNGESVR